MSKRTLLLSCALLLVIAGWLSLTALLSWAGFVDLRQREFDKAQHKFRIASILFWPIDTTLGRASADVHLIGTSLQLGIQGSQVASIVEQYIPLAFSQSRDTQVVASELAQQLPQLDTLFQSWLDTYSQAQILSPLFSQQLPPPLVLAVTESKTENKLLAAQFTQVGQSLLVGNHKIVILLQNTDELRATGGFMGSYMILELKDGSIDRLEVQDIYVPDGQYTGYTPAPPGAEEYLSSGKGLRLPDSNWSPDFPTAAQEVTQFLALGKETEVEAVVAMNVEVVEALLKLTGPLYLPDYSQTVTSENLTTLARADRHQFFPGSQQKRQFLQAVFTQLKIQLTEKVKQQPEQFFSLLAQMIKQKHLQGYAKTSELQQLFTALKMTGQISLPQSSRYLFAVESNVGINKANRLVTRRVELQLLTQSLTYTTEFTNQNPVTNLRQENGDYINYQRLFVPPSYQLQTLLINGQVETQWDDQLITTSTGDELRQLGFLVPVPAQQVATISATLVHPELPLSTFTIQKQAGLPPTPYQVVTPTKKFDFLLEDDVTLNLE